MVQQILRARGHNGFWHEENSLVFFTRVWILVTQDGFWAHLGLVGLCSLF